VAAAQEERFTRKKFDPTFPRYAIDYCLKAGRIAARDLALVTFYEEPYVKLHRLVDTLKTYASFNLLKSSRRIADWMRSKMDPAAEIADICDGQAMPPIAYFQHHLSHAASAFYPSPFKEAAILTVDGVGEWACTSIAVGRGENVDIISEQRFPHSIGLLYSAFTQYLGFKVDSGEYKLMGLAPYGKPLYKDLISQELITISPDGSVELDLRYFDFMAGKQMINEKFCALFGAAPRLPDGPFTEKHIDLASSVQSLVEDIMVRIVSHTVALTGLSQLCLAGGVALNCVANGKILKAGLVDRVWIQPAAGDAGGALGSAFLGLYKHLGQTRTINDDGRDKQKGSLLGPNYTNEEILEVLKAYQVSGRQLRKEEWADTVAQLLTEGKIIGFFQGRMEFGPRALGARSILADPRHQETQRDLNLKIKFRESFRPFAPAVLQERAAEWFDLSQTSPYMLLTTQVASDKKIPSGSSSEQTFKGFDRLKEVRSLIPAVTHVDGSARVQTVDRATDPRFYDVLKAFEKITGCPVLVNTSFNVRGEPIVCTPLDALKCFFNTRIDALVMEDILVLKGKDPHVLQDRNFRNNFASQD